MSIDSDKLKSEVISNAKPENLASGKVGLEKESLRIYQSKISNNLHQQSLGSSLCHRFITTDFSEAQLEFITPPGSNKTVELDFLDNIHHFVTQNIGDEFLWPFSMPPYIQLDTEVPIASYGSSNLALFKTAYRNGLSHRYGRTMQAISGIHFNYSLPEDIWCSSLFNKEQLNLQEFRTDLYFGTLRNLHRMNWLILYLLGASPIVSKNFLNSNHGEFQKLDSHTYYMRYATSLRMSDLGYQNIRQSSLVMPLNSMEEYIFNLKLATETKCEDYQKINKEIKEDCPQINANILQIEDEYYSIARPKSNSGLSQRLTTKLKDTGVDYIELRSLDINPFQRIGIDLETVYFLEMFFLYCTLKSSPQINSDGIQESRSNDLLVATRGREPGLNLSNNRTEISLKNWANQILDEMIYIAELLDDETNIYTDTISKIKLHIMDPDQTLSGMLLNKVLTEQISFHDLGIKIGEENKSYYINMEKPENSDWSLLEQESSDSLRRQAELEKISNQSFDDFVKRYFSE